MSATASLSSPQVTFDLAQYLHASIRETPEGGTIDPRSLTPLFPQTGYWVSQAGFEEKHRVITRLTIERWLARHSHVFETSDDVHFGWWSDGTYTYLDASRWYSRKSDALIAGKVHRQVCIFDCATKSCIFID